MSVRECARIQTFPDDFKFYYNKVAAGYKMIGNAVPVEFAKILAAVIKADLQNQDADVPTSKKKQRKLVNQGS